MSRTLSLPQPGLGEAASGVILCAALAFLAISVHHLVAVPASLMALLLGIACRPIATSVPDAGYRLATGLLLRIGIALLGLSLPLATIAHASGSLVAAAIGGVILTLAVGSGIGLLLGLPPARAFLCAGAVAICGGSAAFAIAAILPDRAASERALAPTVAGITLLSSIAMLLYPQIARGVGLQDPAAGLYLGITIHDVAQVLGAASTMSPTVMANALLAKMVRILCLVPTVSLTALWLARRSRAADRVMPTVRLPLFILGFLLCSAIASSGMVDPALRAAIGSYSSFSVAMATAALGLRISVRDIRGDGWRPIAAMSAATVVLAVYGLIASKVAC